MKTQIHIPNSVGLCKICFNERKQNSAYCGRDDCSPRFPIYYDEIKNFPFLEKTIETFKISPQKLQYVIFTHKDTIYTNYKLPYHLLRHEITHIIQQKNGADEWWDRYFQDNNFRLKQELEAYTNQYKVAREKDYIEAESLLNKIAEDLSSSLYGNIISKKEAIKQIKQNL